MSFKIGKSFLLAIWVPSVAETLQDPCSARAHSALQTSATLPPHITPQHDLTANPTSLQPPTGPTPLRGMTARSPPPHRKIATRSTSRVLRPSGIPAIVASRRTTASPTWAIRRRFGRRTAGLEASIRRVRAIPTEPPQRRWSIEALWGMWVQSAERARWCCIVVMSSRGRNARCWVLILLRDIPPITPSRLRPRRLSLQKNRRDCREQLNRVTSRKTLK